MARLDKETHRVFCINQLKIYKTNSYIHNLRLGRPRIQRFPGVTLQPSLQRLIVALQGFTITIEHAGLATPLAAFLQLRLPGR